MNKEKFYRVVLPLIISVFLVVLVFVYLFAGVKQTNDKVTHEAGQKLQLSVNDFFDVSQKTAEKITLDTSKVDENAAGTYEVTASYKMHKYTITVEVKDTQAPSVIFSKRYVFTDDVAKADITEMAESVYDASEYTLKLIRFEKSASLGRMTDNDLKKLTDSIALPGDEEELLQLGTEEVPTEEGIYRAVLAATDAYGNTQYEEVYVILDKTGASIEDVPDKEVYVSADKLTEAPEISPEEYVITDNVDGRIPAKDIVCGLELRDEAKHEWLVHVSYTDRAGNESSADFLVIVKEASEPGTGEGTTDNTEKPKPDEPEKNDTEQPDNGGTNNGSQSPEKPEKPEQPEYTYSKLDKTMYAVAGVNVRNNPSSSGEKLGRLSEGDAVTVTGQCNETKWYRIDYKGKTGYVSASYLTDKKPQENKTEEEKKEEYAKQRQQALIDAGVGNIVKLDDDTYGVALKDPDQKINGKGGSELLREYLAELNLASHHVYGFWLTSADSNYYGYFAYDPYVSYLNPDTPEYWEEQDAYQDEETGLVYFSYEDWINKENGEPYK